MGKKPTFRAVFFSDAIILSTENREYDPIESGKIPAPKAGVFEL